MAKLLTNTRIYGTGTVDTQLLVRGFLSAHSTSTGALQVSGGIGVSGGGFFGGTVTATNFIGNVTGASGSLTGGTAGQIPYQVSPGITSFFGPGNTGDLLISAGGGQPLFVNTTTIYVGNAVTATNVRGGAANQFIYQSAPGITAFINTGSMYVGRSTLSDNLAGGLSGQFVYQTAPNVTAFINTSSMYVGRAVIADTVAGGIGFVNTVQQNTNAAYYLTFVDSNNTSATAENVFTSSTFVVNPGTGNVGIGTASPTAALHISSLGSAKLLITADTDNITETDVASIELSQDGGITTANFGIDSGNNLVIGSNSTTSPNIYLGTRTDGTSFATAADAKVTILNNGNVGVGVSPSYKLDVDGVVQGRQGLRTGLGYNSYISDRLQFAASTGFSHHQFKQVDPGSGVTRLDLRRYTGTGDGFDSGEMVTFLANGNVGIGTTAPARKLQVTGDITINTVYKDFQSYSGTSNNLMRTWDGVLVAGSDNLTAETYTIIETAVPQDSYMMGGFTIDWFENYSSTNAKTSIQLGGYWNAESNGGFIGWEYTSTNPNIVPTIQVGRKSSNGNTVIILSHFNASYPIVVARDLWLGYSTGAETYGTGWAILQTSSLTGYTNLDPVVARSAQAAGAVSGTTNYVAKFTSSTALGNSQIFDNGTNVAVGFALPQKKLDVAGSGIVASFGTVFGVGSFAGIHFGYSESSLNNDLYKKSALVFERTDANNQGGNASGKIHLLLNNNSTSSANALTDSVVTVDSDANGTIGSVRFGIGTRNPAYRLSVIHASDVWHAQFGTSGGRQIRIGGSTTNGGVIGAYNTDDNSSPAGLFLQRDGGNIGIATTDFSYTASDNTAVVGSFTNNRVFVNGSLQLLGNNDAIVFGRGTSSFMKDEEIGFGWGGGWFMTDSTFLRVRNGSSVILYTPGTIRADSDVRAPIFYDQNNTSYYTDPASTSVLNILTLSGTTGSTPYLNLSNGPTLSTISTGEIILRNLSSLRFTDVNDWNYDTWAGLKFVNSTKTIHIGVGGSQFTTNNVQTGFVNMPNCNLTVERDIRTPIYYDSNNTSYYVDPNSTSNVYAMVSYSYQGNGNVGGTGSASWHPSGIYSAGYNWLYGGINGGGASATNFSDVRANIFYDYNDTNWYIDPNSTSRIRKTNLIASGSSWDDGLNLYSADASNRWNFLVDDAAGDIFRIAYNNSERIRVDLSGNMYVFTGNIYGNVFVDNNAYDWYLDPNGYSRLSRIMLDQARVDTSRYPVGHYATGDTVFEIDPTWTNDQLRAYFNSNNVQWVADSTAPGGYAIQITGNVNVAANSYGSGFPFIPVDQDDIFYMEVWIKSVSGSNGHYMGSIDFDHNFSNLGGNPGSFGYWVMSNSFPGTSWTKYSGYITGFGTSTGQFRAGTEYFTPQALFNYSGGGVSYISGWKCIRVTHQGNRTIVGRSGSIVDNSTYALDIYHPTNYRQLRIRAASEPLIKFSGAYNGGNGGELWQNSGGTFHCNINGSSTAWASVPGPYTVIYGSARSPIFYDQDNTGYYLDPTSTTSIRTVGSWRADSSSWDGEFSGKIQYHSNHWYFQSGNLWLFRNAGGSNVVTFDQSGNLTASGFVRAGTNVYTDANYGYGLVGVYTSVRYQGVFAMGDAYKLPADGTSTGNLYGIAWSHPNAGGIAGNLASHGMLILENGSFQGAWGGGSLRTPSDIRGTIFYDYSDTGYYCDPNGTSILWKPNSATSERWNAHWRALDDGNWRPNQTGDSNYWTNTRGWGTNYGNWDNVWKYGFGGVDIWGSSSGHPQGSGYVHAQGIVSGLHYATSDGGSAYGWMMVGAADATANRYWARGKWGGSTSSWKEFVMSDHNIGYTLYANIMYDSNSTGYYCDPNGYSQFSSGEFNNYSRALRYFFVGTGGNSGNGTEAYCIFQEGGSWSFPYPDLRIAYHTGIKLGANAPSYEGTRVYSDYDMSDLCIQLAGSSNYSFKYKWMWTNDSGYYASINSAHLYPNQGSSYTQWRIDGSRNGYGGIWDSHSAVAGIMYDSGGNGGVYREANGRWYWYHNVGNNSMGIGTSATSASYRVYVLGNGYIQYSYADAFYYASDRKLKENIETISGALDTVSKLRGVTYNLKAEEEKKTYVGVIAQELEEVLPGLINKTKTHEDVEYLSVSYGNLAGLFIEAFKEQTAIINSLKEEIAALKEKIGEK